MRYEFELPPGFLLKGLHHFRTSKGADLWWAYVQTEKPEYSTREWGPYYHFQGAQGFSLEEALANAHKALVKSLEARRAPRPTGLPQIKIDLSSILGRPAKPTFESPSEEPPDSD